jgi:hypothetical protein
MSRKSGEVGLEGFQSHQRVKVRHGSRERAGINLAVRQSVQKINRCTLYIATNIYRKLGRILNER